MYVLCIRMVISVVLHIRMYICKWSIGYCRGSYSAHREQGAPHGGGLHVSKHRQVRKTPSPTPSLTIPPSPPGGQTDQRGNVPASLAATQPRREGVPLSAPAWDMMAQEISRYIRMYHTCSRALQVCIQDRKGLSSQLSGA